MFSELFRTMLPQLLIYTKYLLNALLIVNAVVFVVIYTSKRTGALTKEAYTAIHGFAVITLICFIILRWLLTLV